MSSCKLVMTLAVEGMSVQEERAGLTEIRSMTSATTHEFVLAKGWTTGRFAPAYVNGRQNERKVKEKKINQ
ncbi:unnamed protein product [Ectocarpus sp. 4 AP-2014]